MCIEIVRIVDILSDVLDNFVISDHLVDVQQYDLVHDINKGWFVEDLFHAHDVLGDALPDFFMLSWTTNMLFFALFKLCEFVKELN